MAHATSWAASLGLSAFLLEVDSVEVCLRQQSAVGSVMALELECGESEAGWGGEWAGGIRENLGR